MKNSIQMLLTAMLGSAITLGAVQVPSLLESKEDFSVLKEQKNLSSTGKASIMATGIHTGVNIGPDFSETAARVTPMVVNIRAKINAPAGNGNIFGGDMFEDFFGPFRGMPERGGNRGGGAPRTQDAGGSGVIISKDGYIVTNNHVVENAVEIEVSTSDNRTFKAKVIGTDPSTDLAVLQIKAKDLTPITFGNSEEAKVGQWVLAVGNPFNLTSTVTAGVISAKGRSLGILRDKYRLESFIQTDAAVNPGNSGGALVNLNGSLIGINTAIASTTGAYAGYAFAVPSNLVEKVVADLVKFGAVQRGFLGVTIRDVNTELARQKDLNVQEGVFVDSVNAQSAAAKAGIEKGDVIVKINGEDTKTSSSLQEKIGIKKPGDVIDVTVNREGKLRSFKVTLLNADGKAEATLKPEKGVLAKAGIELENLSDADKKRLKIEAGAKIKVIKAGALRRQQPQVREGFVITKVDKKPVKNAEDLEKILNKAEGVLLIEGMDAFSGEDDYFTLNLD